MKTVEIKFTTVVKIVLMLILLALLIYVINSSQARYELNKQIQISYTTSKYYFDVNLDTTEISAFPATINITAKNNDGINYTNTDLTYTIGLDNSNYTITAVDGNNTRTLAGGSASQETYAVTIEKKVATDESDALNITFTVKTPYSDTKSIKLEMNTTTVLEYYGAVVTNYDCEAEGVDTWRIFHKDEDGRIYLIADDYVPYKNLPTTTAGTALTKGKTDYRAYWNTTAINDYTGSEWILNNTNANAKKWLNKYLTAYPTTTSYAIKAVAYMMDTKSWSSFASEEAEYAIGGPTLELFCASYKVTHPDRYIECDSVTANGYQVKWSDGYSYTTDVSNLTQDDFNSIYIKSNHSNTNGMWLASPSSVANNICDALYSRYLYYNAYNNAYIGFRPVVCLKQGSELQSNGDGTYRIDVPIDAKATYDETSGKIKIEVTYSKNGIAKILDEDGNVLSRNSLTADTGDKLIVNKTYTFTIIDNLGNEKKVKISGIIPAFYGAVVTNYDCEATGVDKWRIFHKDTDGRIYLIADDYVPYDNLPATTAGTALTKGGTDYRAYWNTTAINNYTGNVWISNNTNVNARKWLNKFLTEYPSNGTDGIKATSYMMDTKSWSGFAGDKAEYAIGGPTIELFSASYKVTHPYKYIECDNVNNAGYYVKWSDDTSYTFFVANLTKDDFNKIYINSDQSKATGMWLASPSASSGNVLVTRYDGSLQRYSYSQNLFGFRPVVCLKSGVNLLNNGDGTYKIV